MKKDNNFLISGFGRSGTTFLQRLMDRSGTWTVRHEPGGYYDQKSYVDGESFPQKIQDRFDTYQYYGEVNSLLRYWFHNIQVSKKGLILRNPDEILVSVANRKMYYELPKLAEELNECFQMFENWLIEDKSIKLIQFEKLISDINYCQEIIEHFGVTDLKVEKKFIEKKINKTPFKKVYSVDELPTVIQNKAKETKIIWERIIYNESK